MPKINNFAKILIVLALIIALVGVFLWDEVNKVNPNFNNEVNQNQPKTSTMVIGIRKPDNTTQKIEVNVPMIVAAQE
ncbi:hypothetical protein MBGDC06_00748 [Thermoplasmatales archaeon SCGC AB-539-C06]|nr:hypothetical protein MBGDC06_00748 [Thermoplasmatales archaeon SCGC AB-539-C06]